MLRRTLSHKVTRISYRALPNSYFIDHTIYYKRFSSKDSHNKHRVVHLVSKGTSTLFYIKKSVPWSFRFTGEASHAKTELQSLESFPRIRELTYS